MNRNMRDTDTYCSKSFGVAVKEPRKINNNCSAMQCSITESTFTLHLLVFLTAEKAKSGCSRKILYVCVKFAEEIKLVITFLLYLFMKNNELHDVKFLIKLSNFLITYDEKLRTCDSK
jgi:hypothetical protein